MNAPVRHQNFKSLSCRPIYLYIRNFDLHCILHWFRSSFIIDGYPSTKEQAQLLNFEGVRPGLIVELTANSATDRYDKINTLFDNSFPDPQATRERKFQILANCFNGPLHHTSNLFNVYYFDISGKAIHIIIQEKDHYQLDATET